MVGVNKEELQKTINLLIDHKIAAELKVRKKIRLWEKIFAVRNQGVQEENARLREELDDNRRYLRLPRARFKVGPKMYHIFLRAFEEDSKSRRLYYLTESKQTDVVTGQLTSTMWRILTGAMIMFMQVRTRIHLVPPRVFML